MFYIFCRVDHDSTKQEFCYCDTKSSQESCDTSINKVGFFYLQEKGGGGGGEKEKTKVFIFSLALVLFTVLPLSLY
jgi:hypothetical protein